MKKTTLNRQMIAQERSYNRKYNVKNNCIPAFVKNNYRTENDDGTIEYKWEKVKIPLKRHICLWMASALNGGNRLFCGQNFMII